MRAVRRDKGHAHRERVTHIILRMKQYPFHQILSLHVAFHHCMKIPTMIVHHVLCVAYMAVVVLAVVLVHVHVGTVSSSEVRAGCWLVRGWRSVGVIDA